MQNKTAFLAVCAAKTPNFTDKILDIIRKNSLLWVIGVFWIWSVESICIFYPVLKCLEMVFITFFTFLSKNKQKSYDFLRKTTI